VFLGFTYNRTKSAPGVPSFTSTGGGGQFVHNFFSLGNSSVFGMAADVGLYNGNFGALHVNSTSINFLFGPRITFFQHSRLHPYIQTLVGGVHTSSNTQITLPAAGLPSQNPGYVTDRTSNQETGFAMTIGGGLDIKINRHLSFRPIGIDYYLTRLDHLRSPIDNAQHNFRYTAGVTFTLGGEKPSPPPPLYKSCPDGSLVSPGVECPHPLPALPWPPPQPSTRTVIPPSAFASAKDFGELSSRLDAALQQSGYVEKSYYSVPGGIGIVTRLERIYSDGRPFGPQSRWQIDDSSLEDRSFMSYVKALFGASEGYYRVIVLIVTGIPFGSSEPSMTPAKADTILARGYNKLPEGVSKQPLPSDYACTALVYEFLREQGKDPAPLLPSRLTARAHLIASGFWTALGMQP
jgi:hypothetical protein